MWKDRLGVLVHTFFKAITQTDGVCRKNPIRYVIWKESNLTVQGKPLIWVEAFWHLFEQLEISFYIKGRWWKQGRQWTRVRSDISIICHIMILVVFVCCIVLLLLVLQLVKLPTGIYLTKLRYCCNLYSSESTQKGDDDENEVLAVNCWKSWYCVVDKWMNGDGKASEWLWLFNLCDRHELILLYFPLQTRLLWINLTFCNLCTKIFIFNANFTLWPTVGCFVWPGTLHWYSHAG